MGYTMYGKNLLGLACDEDHVIASYAVRISDAPRGRWATVGCSCGATARTFWEDTTADYRSMVFVAWFDACGSTARLDAESLPLSRE